MGLAGVVLGAELLGAIAGTLELMRAGCGVVRKPRSWRAVVGNVVLLLLLAFPTVQAVRFWTAPGRGVFVVERCSGGTVAANGWCDGTVVPDDGGRSFGDDVYEPDDAPAPGDRFAIRYRDDVFGTWVAHDRAAVGVAWTLSAFTPLVAVAGLLVVFKLVAAHRTTLAVAAVLPSTGLLLVGPILLGTGLARPVA